MLQKSLLIPIIIFVSLSLAAQTPNAGPDQIICASETQMQANPPEEGFMGEWELVSGTGLIANPTLYNTQITGIKEGESLFSWSFNGLSDYVSINNMSVEAFAGDDQFLPPFVNQTFMTAAPIPECQTGLWSILSGNAMIHDPNSPQSEISSIASGENSFRWTVQNDHCSAYDNVSIFGFPHYPDECDAGNNRHVCTDSIYLHARDEGSNQQFWTVVSGSALFANSSDNHTQVRNLAYGENVLRWTVIMNGLSCEDEVTITNHKPDAQFVLSPEIFYAPGFVHILNYTAIYPGQNPPDQYLWSVDDVPFDTTYTVGEQIQIYFDNTETGTIDHTIRMQALENTHGCLDTAYQTVQVIYTVSTDEKSSKSVKLRTNPAAAEIIVDNPMPMSGTAFLYDAKGNLRKQSDFNHTSEIRMPVPDLASGIYFLRILGETINYSEKLIILRD